MFEGRQEVAFIHRSNPVKSGARTQLSQPTNFRKIGAVHRAFESSVGNAFDTLFDDARISGQSVKIFDPDAKIDSSSIA